MKQRRRVDPVFRRLIHLAESIRYVEARKTKERKVHQLCRALVVEISRKGELRDR